MIKWIMKLYKKYEEIILYLIMGVLATIVSIGVKWVTLYTFLDATNGFHVQIAVIVSWIIACIFAYATNRKWVFKSKDKNIIKEFFKFIGARVFTLLIEMLIMYFFITFLGMNSDIWVAIWTIVAQIFVVILNYVFSKLFIFKKAKNKGEKNEKN